MVAGIGVDMVNIARFQRFLDEGNEPLFRRVFTPLEMEYCKARREAAQHFALRFAAKEAFLKALGLGLRDGISWKEMEVVNDRLGKPELRLSGRADHVFRDRDLRSLFLSLSHDGAYGVAMVVLEA